MVIRSRLTLCFVVASLTACAPIDPLARKGDIGPPVPCDNAGVCQIYIEVMYCGRDGLRVTPEHVGILEPKDIQWTIVTGDYRFPPDGISASDGIVVNGSGFSRHPGVTGNGKKFIVNDAKTDYGNPIKYSVHVLKKDLSECTGYDPYISNQ